MDLPTDAVLLRIFVREEDQYGEEPLFRAIVLKARELHLAGATVFRGPLGFGGSGLLHSSGARLHWDLPIVIEIVDSEAKIRNFLTESEILCASALITTERVQALFYQGRQREKKAKGGSTKRWRYFN
jgi:uncharacterized protein